MPAVSALITGNPPHHPLAHPGGIKRRLGVNFTAALAAAISASLIQSANSSAMAPNASPASQTASTDAPPLREQRNGSHERFECAQAGWTRPATARSSARVTDYARPSRMI